MTNGVGFSENDGYLYYGIIVNGNFAPFSSPDWESFIRHVHRKNHNWGFEKKLKPEFITLEKLIRWEDE